MGQFYCKLFNIKYLHKTGTTFERIHAPKKLFTFR